MARYAHIQKSRAAEMAPAMTDGDLKMPFYYEIFGESRKGAVCIC